MSFNRRKFPCGIPSGRPCINIGKKSDINVHQGLRAPQGPRAPSFSMLYGLRPPSFKGLRAPVVQCPRAPSFDVNVQVEESPSAWVTTEGVDVDMIEEESPSAWVTTEEDDVIMIEDEVSTDAPIGENVKNQREGFSEPIFMGAMIDVKELDEEELIFQNESELAATVDETFVDYCKRVKKKASKKLKAKWQREQQNAIDQLEKNDKLREKRRKAKETQNVNERKRKLKEARELQNLRNENESKSTKKRKLDSNKVTKAVSRKNESEEQREARLQAQREIQSQLRENESEDQRQARLEADRRQHSDTRENESVVQKEVRLEADRSQHSNARVNESEIQREERLEDMRNAYHERRGNLPREFHAANSENVQEFSLGPRNVECEGCKAEHFACESKMNKAYVKGSYDSCCNGGKVKVNFSPYPERLERLMKREEGTDWRELEPDILKFNTSLSFAYTKGEMRQLPGIFHYRVQGELMHMLPRYTDPMPNQKPAFGQLWIIETDDAIEYRCQAPFAERCSRSMMEFLHNLIASCNKYAEMYKMLHEIEEEEHAKAQEEGREPKVCKIVFKKVTENTSDPQTFPRVNEVAAIYVCDEDGDIPWEDMHVQSKCNPGETPMSSKISKYSKHIEPLTFVLFYPFGTGDFWFYNKPKNPSNPTLGKMTALQYFLAKLAYRPANDQENFNPLHYGGKLLSKYLVWSYMIVDNERIKYLRTHQKEFRVESYGGLKDYLRNYEERNGVRIGKRVILPSSYNQGPRNKSENFHDTVSSMRKNGAPHLFITMTSNPEHIDVLNCLLGNQRPYDRPDVVDEVFNYHVKQFIKEMNEGLFGKVKSFVYVVEFQKRGLPHIHSLWTFEEGWTDINKINRFISGELPDKDEDQELYDLVVKFMMHRPCGRYDPNAMCMQDGKCKRGFLRAFCDETELSEDSYPSYRRRDDGKTATINFKGRPFVLDNRSVVPYNAYLLKRFKCHINVEVVSSLRSINYLFKYLFKGPDKIEIEIRENNDGIYDEIKCFMGARYVSSHEGFWRLRKFDMYYCSESIERLQVHLEGRQMVTVPDDPSEEEMITAMMKKSKLLAFFKLNRDFPNGPNRNITYLNVCYGFTWDAQKCEWKTRKRTTKPKCPRMYAVNPKQAELFYLRKLLTVVKGPQGYEDLKRDPLDPNLIYATFREACISRGLVESDQMYYDALEEGSCHSMPRQLRSLFARIVAHCDVEAPLWLWNQFRFQLIGDLLRSHNNDADLAEALAMKQVLRMIINNDRSLEDYPILQEVADIVGIEEEEVDITAHRLRGEEMRASLNHEQGDAYEAIKAKVYNPDDSASCFYLNGPGGTGKTYLFNCLYSNLIADKKKVIVMSWSGIAASLYETGRTCHNVFKLDFPFGDESNSGVSILDSLGKDLEKVDVIIWDEAPMAPRHALEVIDKKLQDIMNNNVPFGGKVMVLGGDFRQLGPVVKNGTRNDVVRSSIKTSSLWAHFEANHFSLIRNERAAESRDNFAQEILRIGDGSANDNNGKVHLPSECITEDDLVEEIYQDIIEAKDFKTLSKRAILSTLNAEVDAYNEKVIDLLDPETEKIYEAIDRVESIGDGDSIEYSPEQFESFKPSGFPAYNLRLRENTVVMLMRNLSIREGLCNGTRLLVKKLERNIIIAEKLTNVKEGEDPLVMIPRITLLDESSMFQVYRKQFPIRPAFALTINKSQGQTFDEIGIDISKGIFTHGHLYVAISRTRSWEKLKIKVHADDVNCSRNIVYTELLTNKPLEVLNEDNNERNLNEDWDFGRDDQDNENVEVEGEDEDGDEQMRFNEVLNNERENLEDDESYACDDEDMRMFNSSD